MNSASGRGCSIAACNCPWRCLFYSGLCYLDLSVLQQPALPPGRVCPTAAVMTLDCLFYWCAALWTRVGNFRQKNNSAEDGIVGTNGYFRRNSGCSAEQKLSEFRSEPSVEETTTRNSVPRTKNRSKLLEFPSKPFRERENHPDFRSWNKDRSKLSEFPSETFSGRENNSEFRSVEQK